MDYSHIVALIDAYIDRLQRARKLLAPVHASPTSSRKKAVKRSASSLALIAIEVERPLAQSLEIHPSPTPPAPRVIPPARLRRKSTVVRSSVPAVKTALGGNVPVAPVVVSAEQVRLQQAHREASPTPEQKLDAMEIEAISVDALTRKWLQNATV
jgi:hypothetical protein